MTRLDKNPPADSCPARPRRFLSLDLLKAAGIIYLIFLHQMIFLLVKDDTGGVVFPEAKRVISVLGYRTGAHVLGLIVPMLAGCTFFLQTVFKKYTWSDVLKRSAVLAGLGVLLNVLAWGFSDLLTWDVLGFIGISMLITYAVFRHCPVLLQTVILLGWIAAGLALSDRYPFSQWQSSYWYVIVFGDQASGHYWPLFPWYGIFAAGFLSGRILLSKIRKRMLLMLLAGMGCLAVSVVSGHYLPPETFDDIWGYKLFKPHPFFVLGVIGAGLTLMSALELLIPRFTNIFNALARSPLMYYSYGILWIFVIVTAAGSRLTNLVYALFPDMTFARSMIVMPLLTIGELILAFLIGKAVASTRKNPYA